MSLARWGPCSVTALKDPRTKLEASAPESPLQLEKQLPDYDISASIFTIEMQVLVDSDIIIMQADIRLSLFIFSLKNFLRMKGLVGPMVVRVVACAKSVPHTSHLVY